MASFPPRKLKRSNVKVDIPHAREPLTAEQFVKLFRTTLASTKPVEDLEGETRAMVYALAFCSGLRRREIASLTPESFTLGESPSLVVEAANSKHRDLDVAPIRPANVPSLVAWLAKLPAGQPLVPNFATKDTRH